MLLPMQFLKQMEILPHSMQPRYLNVMTVRNLCDKFQANIQNYSTGMMSSFFQRTTLLQNLCHAKQLLLTQGTESFKEAFTKIFALDKKD